MKRFMVLILAAMFMIPAAMAYADDPNAVLGTWTVENGKAKVQFYQCGSDYCGKIVWLREPNEADGKPKLDKNNPDAGRRGQPLMGINMVWGFKYKGDNTWADGSIYDPESGKTYYCKIKLLQDGRLKVRGSLTKMGVFGKTQHWRK